MITGFLFILKVLGGDVNWLNFFESRFFRIYPLYLSALSIVFFLVFMLSDFQLQAAPVELGYECLKWLLFHGESLNRFEDAPLLMAGVVWTLKYEWLFYCLLPFIGLSIKYGGRSARLFLLVFSAILYFWPLSYLSINSKYLLLFSIGGIAAYLLKQGCFLWLLQSGYQSVLAFFIILLAIFYPYPFTLMHICLMGCFFVLVVLGADLFGLLCSRAAILLGEISFSIYLLHGVVLYVIFTQLNCVDVRNMSMAQYSLLMPFVSVFVILVSCATFLLIEKPFIDFGRCYILSGLLGRLASFLRVKVNGILFPFFNR